MLWQNGGTAILNKAEEIAKDVLAVDAERVDRDAGWPENGLRTLLAEGFGSLVVPKQYGGRDSGRVRVRRC